MLHKSLHHLLSKMHDWGVVVWQVVNVGLEFLKIPQSILGKSKKKKVYFQ